ncbi:hypothetical protein KM043_013765 [Ampulex compressa]|nr:hypothetical protein KM043_013765 [Ampulex compressa]
MQAFHELLILLHRKDRPATSDGTDEQWTAGEKSHMHRGANCRAWRTAVEAGGEKRRWLTSRRSVMVPRSLNMLRNVDTIARSRTPLSHGGRLAL